MAETLSSYAGGVLQEQAPFRITGIDRGVLLQMSHSMTTLGIAYLSGDFDVEGDLEAAYRHFRMRAPSPSSGAPESSVRVSGIELTKARSQVNEHYDLPIDFWAPWLGESMLYTCGVYAHPEDDLTVAQYRKVERICRKLELAPSQQLLDVGCGWGGLGVKAASDFGARVTGLTLSDKQAAHARRRIANEGVADRCTVIVGDYRQLEQAPFDKIAAVGISEHLGDDLASFFERMCQLVKPEGMLLNQGIVYSPGSSYAGGEEFIRELIFPGATIRPIGYVLAEAENAGFEIVDVENLSPHYVLTLREWLRRLERHAERLCEVAGERTWRRFRAYLAGFACEFDVGTLRVYQTLLRRPGSATRERLVRV